MPLKTRIVVICPVYNEQENIPYFFERLSKTIEQLDHSRYECRLLIMNNRSTDLSHERMRELRRNCEWVSYATLSRNFGYERSVLAGLSLAEADLYMICDADCEDPPEMLSVFLAAIERGRDLAYGLRTNRPDTWLMSRMRSAFYFLLRQLGDYTIVSHMAEFAMFRRAVRDALLANINSFPFIRAEVGYVGFNIEGLPYRREARRYGSSHYNFLGSFRFAITGILSSTTFPLRAALYLLPLIILANLGVGGLFLFKSLGFESTVVLLLGGNTLYAAVAIAFQSVYLARVYHNGLGRKRFIVDPSLSDLGSLTLSQERTASD